MKVYASSRRTIMSGEVVTFATAFKQVEMTFGPGWEAAGPFEVSASRDGVMVHRCLCTAPESVEALRVALTQAEAAMLRLREVGYGAKSLYPAEPQEAGGAA